MELNDLAILVEGHLKKHFCEIVLKSGHWPRRKFRLKVFLLFAFASIFFSDAEPF